MSVCDQPLLASSEWIEELRSKLLDQRSRITTTIAVCGGTGCRAYRCQDVIDAFGAELDRRSLSEEVRLISTGCHGFCERGPLAVIQPTGVFYQKIKPDDVSEIIEKTVLAGQIIERLLYRDPQSGERIELEKDVPFYKYQHRLILGANGNIDPESIDDYIVTGGYAALAKALTESTPAETIARIERSGLRGRGGGGFLTARKWEITRDQPGEKKYIICNADEGDPGAYMDRSILEGNPHSVLEGMVIGAWVVGADEGYVYVRAEYPLALSNIDRAIEQAIEYGLLGENILGSGFDFRVHVSRGAGAFVCGEETALIASIEGRLGTPSPKPPYPAQEGLWGRPTNINNVETWANVPLILSKGEDWFASTGTETSKGTKVFSLVGKIHNTGLVEVPMGISLRDVVFKIGGGIPNGRRFKAVQTGGPSGGVIPEELLDLPVDYEALKEAGAMMGSGGMIVMDDRTCMVDVARYFMNFLCEESCGQCTPCREGIKLMREILNRIGEGEGTEADIESLQQIALGVKNASLCGLGTTAPNPVLSTLKYFQDEYLAHVRDKRCEAGVCSALISLSIDETICNSCGRCIKVCPVEAIEGGRKKVPASIDDEKCIRCRACLEVCPKEAVQVS